MWHCVMLCPVLKCTFVCSRKSVGNQMIVFLCAVQVGVTQVEPDVLQQAKDAEVVTFGSPSAVK